MISEFFDEEAAIVELQSKLRHIQDSLAPLIRNETIDSNLVPKEIREEIVQVYDEHGGIDLLSSLTKVSINVINMWHKRWQYNPFVYRTATVLKPRKANTLIRRVLDPLPIETRLTKSQQVITQDSTITEMMRSKINASEEEHVKSIKKLIESKMKEGLEMDEEVADEVRKLFYVLGDTREIAILLGISQDIIEEWMNEMTIDDL